MSASCLCLARPTTTKLFFSPHEFDITRDTSPNLTFGAGPHVCAGAAASRSLVGDSAPARIERLHNMSLDDSAPPTRFGGWAFRGPLNMAAADHRDVPDTDITTTLLCGDRPCQHLPWPLVQNARVEQEVLEWFHRHGILMPRSWNGELNLSIQVGGSIVGSQWRGSAFRHGQTELPIE